jgi:hypothetical protein
MSNGNGIGQPPDGYIDTHPDEDFSDYVNETEEEEEEEESDEENDDD